MNKFPIGNLYATKGVLDLGIPFPELVSYVSRHASGDYGDICDEDWELNDEAIKNGERIFSKYNTEKGAIYIITEADRSMTTILLPEEY